MSFKKNVQQQVWTKAFARRREAHFVPLFGILALDQLGTPEKR